MFFAFLNVLFLLIASSAAHTPGTATVDTLTFDKVRAHFDVVLAKFDDKFPFGDKQDQFKQFALDVSNSKGFLITEIPITDFGDKENEALAIKYNVKKADFPVYKLFLKGKPEPIDYTGDKSGDDLKRFLSQNTNTWFGLPGTIEEFDRFAQEFFIASSSKDENQQKSVLEKAREQTKGLVDKKEQKNGEAYVKIMEAVVKQGIDFLAREGRRVQNLLKGKVSKEKKVELQQRANIILSFKPLKGLLNESEYTITTANNDNTDL